MVSTNLPLQLQFSPTIPQHPQPHPYPANQVKRLCVLLYQLYYSQRDSRARPPYLFSMTVTVMAAEQVTEISLTADRPVNFRNKAEGQQVYQHRQTHTRTSIHICGLLADIDNIYKFLAFSFTSDISNLIYLVYVFPIFS